MRFYLLLRPVEFVYRTRNPIENPEIHQTSRLTFPDQARLLIKAFPKVQRPKVARILNPMGSGFPDLIARGIELPAKMMEARRASSTP